ncbi:MAG: ParB/RepB/Spo0J family partition protein [Alcaligenaceae bacterium]
MDEKLDHQPAHDAFIEKKGLEQFLLPITEIVVKHDNGLIYGDFGLANADDLELANSINENGVLEPLVISVDRVLLSGHRRLAAAMFLDLGEVPVRMIEIVYEDLKPSDRLKLLQSFNQQREKTVGERIKEKLLTIDPAKAHTELKARKEKILRGEGVPEANVDMGQVKKRPRITTRRFLAAVKMVINAQKPYWPLTDRRIHYLLLNDPPLRHDKKPDSVYANDKGSYKTLTHLLLRARLTGDIPMRAIEDSTRPVQLTDGFSSPEEFIAQETEDFLTGYTRNLMQGQPYHIEIMLEKNALRSVIETVAREYNIPITTARGFSSLGPRYDIFRRFKNSGKIRLVVLMLTDFDPDGEEIAASFVRSLRDDFGIENIHAVKVALTADDVRQYALPSDMDAKDSSPNYAKFVEKHNSTKVVELDAAPVDLLQDSLRKSIEAHLDIEEYNAQLEQAKQDSAIIEARRQVVFDMNR